MTKEHSPPGEEGSKHLWNIGELIQRNLIGCGASMVLLCTKCFRSLEIAETEFIIIYDSVGRPLHVLSVQDLKCYTVCYPFQI
jgi:hypothetical protein